MAAKPASAIDSTVSRSGNDAPVRLALAKQEVTEVPVVGNQSTASGMRQYFCIRQTGTMTLCDQGSVVAMSVDVQE